MPLFELVAIVLAAVVAVAMPSVGQRTFHRLGRWWARLANRRYLSVLLSGVVAFTASAALSILVHWPVPAVPDEFAYVLMGDTFAHGRLTNPTHPMWEFFETLHVIHQPTYQGKYPPGQGAFLALGQVLIGYPIAGVWIGFACAIAATVWMLQAWLPPRWALLGGVVALLNYQLLLYWSQTFWGGGVPMLGGALLFGGLRRVVARQRIRDGLILGLGLVLLSMTRPYEGLAASLPAAVLLLGWIIREVTRGEVAKVVRAALPIGLILAAGAAATLYYNQQVTHKPTHFPYVHFHQVYNRMRFTYLSTERPDEVRQLRLMRQTPQDPRDWKNVQPRATFLKLLKQWELNWRILLTPLLLALPCALRQRWMLFALVAWGCTFAAHAYWGVRANSHYMAPAEPAAILLTIAAMRSLYLCAPGGRAFGRAFVRLLLLAYVATMFHWLPDYIKQPVPPLNEWSIARAKIQEQLEQRHGADLVLVEYSRYHPMYDEWIYNAADIDGAPVVWALDRGEETLPPLLEYFRDRTVWKVQADARPIRLEHVRDAETSRE